MQWQQRDYFRSTTDIDRLVSNDFSCRLSHRDRSNSSAHRLQPRVRRAVASASRYVIIGPLRQMRCAIAARSMTVMHNNGSNITAIITLLPKRREHLTAAATRPDDLPDVSRNVVERRSRRRFFNTHTLPRFHVFHCCDAAFRNERARFFLGCNILSRCSGFVSEYFAFL